jgi:hypothetical protein
MSSEDLRITERYHRRDFGHIDLQMKVDDSKTFSRPWTINAELVFAPDTEMLEFVCNENEKDRQHYVLTENTGNNGIKVDVALLAKYAGTYQVTGPGGNVVTVSVTLEGDQLMMALPGRPRGPLVPQSATMFVGQMGGVTEFITNEQGVVTHLIAHTAGAEIKLSRTGPPR